MKRLIAAIALWLISTVAIGLDKDDCTFCVKPYVGGDVQWRKGGFKIGDNFPNQFLQTNVYGGIHLNDAISAEVGTDRTHKSYSYYRNHSYFRGLYVSAVFNQPLGDSENCDVVGGVGYSFKKGIYREARTNIGTERKKAIPRLMGGVQYLITPQLKWRAAAIWENTRELKAAHDRLGPIKPENTLTYSIGLNYSF